MKTLAVIAVVLICLLVIGSQHLFNEWIRKDLGETPLPLFGVLGIVLSLLLLWATIYNAVVIF